MKDNREADQDFGSTGPDLTEYLENVNKRSAPYRNYVTLNPGAIDTSGCCGKLSCTT